MLKHALFLLFVVATVGDVQTATAGALLSTDRFGYEGSYMRYDTLTDAQAGTNSTGTGLMPQRDLSIYIAYDDTTNTYSPGFYILTAWYPTSDPDPSHAGYGNPSNTNDGFFQYYDADASTVQSVLASWNSAGTEYTVQAHAENADYAHDFTRFGEVPGGPGPDTEAYFHSLDVDFTISGLSSSYDSTTSMYVDGSSEASASISGSLSGIVENVGTDSSRHGFYVFDLNLNNTSWAYQNNLLAPDSVYAGTTTVTPEPSSLALALLGLGGFPVIGYRRRKRKPTQADA